MSSIKRYLFTSAQNNTEVHDKGLKSLLNYCKHNKTELKVMPFSGFGKKEEYDSKLSEYLLNKEDFYLLKNLQVVGNISINYQAVDSVSGLENITKDASCLVPGTSLRVKVIPVKKNKIPKVLICSGAITLPNYKNTALGYKAKKRHTISAIYIETDGDKTFHFRQVIINPINGEFYDLDKKYTPKGVENGRCLALVCGDTHVPNHDVDVIKSTFFSSRSLFSTVKPEKILLHDLLDFRSASHHVGTSMDIYRKELKSEHKVEVELDRVALFLNKLPKCPTYIIESNHNGHLTHWLNGDKPEGINLKIWFELNVERFKHENRNKNPLEIHLENKGLVNYNFLTESSSLMVGGMELSMHGHLGANGAKGSIKTFCNSGVPTVTGHTHTPQIYQGSYIVGTNSKMDMGYNKGLSSWMHTSCLVYPYGATLINFIDGEWRF